MTVYDDTPKSSKLISRKIWMAEKFLWIFTQKVFMSTWLVGKESNLGSSKPNSCLIFNLPKCQFGFDGFFRRESFYIATYYQTTERNLGEASIWNRARHHADVRLLLDQFWHYFMAKKRKSKMLIANEKMQGSNLFPGEFQNLQFAIFWDFLCMNKVQQFKKKKLHWIWIEQSAFHTAIKSNILYRAFTKKKKDRQ